MWKSVILNPAMGSTKHTKGTKEEDLWMMAGLTQRVSRARKVTPSLGNKMTASVVAGVSDPGYSAEAAVRLFPKDGITPSFSCPFVPFVDLPFPFSG